MPAVDANLRRHIRSLHLETVEEYQAWLRRSGLNPALNKTWQERRQELERMEQLKAGDAADTALMRHINDLGFGTPDEYAAWRRQHGLRDAAHGSKLQRQKERETAATERAQAALAAARRDQRGAADALLALARGGDPSVHTPFLRLARETFTAARRVDREPLLRLLIRAQNRTELSSVEPAIPELGPRPGNTFTEALLALARHRDHWLRGPEDWQPESHNARRQFGSLARWLLAKYPVPAFMDSAFFLPDSRGARQRQEWFIHIGRGENIRHARIPIPLTSRAVHYFLKAPSDFSIEQAFRWGQIRGLGGDERLARAVAASALREVMSDEPFWFTVLQFLVNQEMLDYACVGPLIDFIHERKFVPANRDAGPVDPAFSMKGRTFTALWRMVEEWQRQLTRDLRKIPVEWKPAGFRWFRYDEEDQETGEISRWTIQELLTTAELQEEGRAMRHCAASYVRSCAGGRISIWSMRVEESPSGLPRRVMTIELQNTTRSIIQARGRCNLQPGTRRSSVRLKRAPEILKKWAAQEGLRIAG